MTMKAMKFVSLVFLASAAFAKPAEKAVPVADGFPDWRGVTEKNYVFGRRICAADLRHKLTVVIAFDAAQAAEHLALTKEIGRTYPLFVSDAWETENLRRDFIALYTFAGADGQKAVADTLSKKDKSLSGFSPAACVYADVTCAGLPAPTDLPFISVFGPDGGEPLLARKFDGEALKAFGAIKKQQLSKMPKWERFYGSVGAENAFPQLKKAVDAGKPLAPVLSVLHKACLSSDADKAGEAQILSDAVEQTRSDLVYQLYCEYKAKPHCALRDVNLLTCHWPEEKANPLLAQVFRALSNPEVKTYGAIYQKLSVWSDANFRCKSAGEAKKIVQELKKMKKTLGTLKESANVVTQNNASTLELTVDSLIESVPTKVK